MWDFSQRDDKERWMSIDYWAQSTMALLERWILDSQIHIWSIGWCTERAGTWDKWIIRVVWGVKNLESWLNLLRKVKALLVLSHLQRGRSGFNSKFQFQYYGNVFGSEYLKTALEILHKYLQILYFKTWHIWWHIWWCII